MRSNIWKVFTSKSACAFSQKVCTKIESREHWQGTVHTQLPYSQNNCKQFFCGAYISECSKIVIEQGITTLK